MMTGFTGCIPEQGVRAAKVTHAYSAIFPHSVDDMDLRVQEVTAQVLSSRDALLHDPTNTFAATFGVLDEFGKQLDICASVLHATTMTHPDALMRARASELIVQLGEFSVREISHHVPLYERLQRAVSAFDYTALKKDQQLCVTEVMDAYRRNGCAAAPEVRQRISEILKELSQLSVEFQNAVNSDDRTIIVRDDELAGIPERIKASFERDEKGCYVLHTDYPTVDAVMESCSVSETRRKMRDAFIHRAYPDNITRLQRVAALRDELASLTGYPSYAASDIDQKMAKTPERVRTFLDVLDKATRSLAEEELSYLRAYKPDDVVLDENGLFNPWDMGYVREYIQRTYNAVDESVVAEYFPAEHALQEMLRIYEEFFNISFTQEPIPAGTLWADDLYLASVTDAHGVVRGRIIMDLYPRAHKYTHACMMQVIPAQKTPDNTFIPAVIMVIANFPRPHNGVPGLLKRRDVLTFFHEFGHALHGVLGATELAGFSGTNVKRDFVELPSQMLEEWLWEPTMLKRVSKHYVTGEPLPDELIERIVARRRLDQGGLWVQRQIGLSRVSLEYFGPQTRSPQELYIAMMQGVISGARLDKEAPFMASFGHLLGYGSCYYSYLWALVFARDLFDVIKQEGLLNPAVGQRYVSCILAPGGSQDPYDMLRAFLGREPREEALADALAALPLPTIQAA